MSKDHMADTHLRNVRFGGGGGGAVALENTDTGLATETFSLVGPSPLLPYRQSLASTSAQIKRYMA